MTDGAPPIQARPSPNFGPRRPDADGRQAAVDMLVLHYTDMENATVSLDRLCDPSAQVSAHYLIDEDGTIHQLVAEAERAWHAGLAYWRGIRDVNSRSIGIELQNPGHRLGYRPFPDAQIDSLIALAHDLLTRHPIRPRNILGHSDVAPARKRDPGELFPWPRLAAHGIGLWPDGPVEAGGSLPDILAGIGYDREAEHLVEAFQRRYRPARIDGRADAETTGLAAAVLALCEETDTPRAEGDEEP
ncbi:N-acetylmuramoyl-L-alanine amidase [Marivibrio halodurans]|uniref:N-acetylmuramoyl-L-alanine amidase n=1 Tax=Marivibrio halodurans TaxID=2039722 RepID=A0A8J7V2P6_9PROT|nr:N-acetylmuramoyl-L-alanine amidase [Marivibrio halodurans]MBP5857550.1 N-acetylmuramoyl-L-alanine amidase [Marivibrio halodurans]